MRRVAVTGVSVLSAAGAGVESFRSALRRASPLGSEEAVPGLAGVPLRVRVARLAGFEPSDVLSAAASRRMSPESCAVTSAAILAWRDAGASGVNGPAGDVRIVPPGRVGTFFGSSFGCLRTSADYLRGIFQEGMAMASPALFSESLASSPAGHVAIAIDARGASLTCASGDVAMLSALHAAVAAVRQGRVDLAVCGAFEFMPFEVVCALARLSSPRAGLPSFGEGVVVLILEDLEEARLSGRKVLAEVHGVGLAGDPEARPTDWSRDPQAWSQACARALMRSEGRNHSSGATWPAAAGASGAAGSMVAADSLAGAGVQPTAGATASMPAGFGAVVLHRPPSDAAARAEAMAVAAFTGAGQATTISDVHRVFGTHAAGGGFTVAAAILAAPPGSPVLVTGGSWGGATAAAILTPE